MVIPLDHGGPARARNVGAESSEGDIILFLDSDCIVTENWYEEMLKPFEDKDVVAVQGAYINAFPENIISTYEQIQIDLRQPKTMTEIDNFASYSLAIRRDIFEKAGGFDESFKTSSAEDTFLSYKVNKFGKIVHNPKARVKHYHKTSLYSYLRKQFVHARNRVSMYFKLRFEKIGDSYAGISILVQPFLAGLSLLTVFHISFVIPFIILCLLQLKDVIKVKTLKKETFAINILRAYAWFFGLIAGILDELRVR